jgi:hypothetical protein
LWLGADTDTAEIRDRIEEDIGLDHLPIAVGELVKRLIVPGTFWIIGFPRETAEPMAATLKAAAHFDVPSSRRALRRVPVPPDPGQGGLRAAAAGDPRTVGGTRERGAARVNAPPMTKSRNGTRSGVSTVVGSCVPSR